MQPSQLLDAMRTDYGKPFVAVFEQAPELSVTLAIDLYKLIRTPDDLVIESVQISLTEGDWKGNRTMGYQKLTYYNQVEMTLLYQPDIDTTRKELITLETVTVSVYINPPSGSGSRELVKAFEVPTCKLSRIESYGELFKLLASLDGFELVR